MRLFRQITNWARIPLRSFQHVIATDKSEIEKDFRVKLPRLRMDISGQDLQSIYHNDDVTVRRVNISNLLAGKRVFRTPRPPTERPRAKMTQPPPQLTNHQMLHQHSARCSFIFSRTTPLHRLQQKNKKPFFFFFYFVRLFLLVEPSSLTIAIIMPRSEVS